MNISLRSDSNSLRGALAVAIYLALLGAAVASIWIGLSTLSERRATILAAENLLAELEGRSSLASRTPLALAPTERPFLEGPTVTVAGAALLQRVGGAISRAGGSVLSSQVDLQRADSKDGWIGLTVSCDIEQGSLQKLLYDLEAGVPFLFIDQLVVQTPVTGVDQNRMRVLLTVSGQWWSGK
jgi:general secretion pathway protein M